MPKVSIIIATHSRPDLLPRAVESAFKAGTDVEVIVVDDASTDETAEVCQKMEGIKYIRVERNQRVAGARNLGILASTAEYISFHDDDDLRLPGSLDKQIAILDAKPEAAFVYGIAIDGDENCNPISESLPQNNYPKGDIFWDILGKDFISCGSVVIRKQCFYKIGLLDKELQGLDDWDLWIRLSEIFPVEFIEEPVYIWRTATPYSDQGTSNLASILLKAVEAYKKKWFELPRLKQSPIKQKMEVYNKARYWMASMLIWEGIQALNNKTISLAQKNFKAAIKINPRLFFHPKTLFNIIKYSSVSHSKD